MRKKKEMEREKLSRNSLFRDMERKLFHKVTADILRMVKSWTSREDVDDTKLDLSEIMGSVLVVREINDQETEDVRWVDELGVQVESPYAEYHLKWDDMSMDFLLMLHQHVEGVLSREL